MRVFTLTEMQANAILDTRLRSLRKLEEMELKRELDELHGREGRRSRTLLGSEASAVEDGRLGDPRGPQDLRARHRRSGAAAPPSRMRPTPPTSISPRRWSSASR